MIVKSKKINIETSGGMDEKSFSIGDVGMIFDILRTKMYSNPILAICREITCNARDTHREVGKFQTPIQISLPNTFSRFFKIKDWGMGISPDRIENIFIKYAASTKRDSNVQVGAFGIGSKTPFAYSDTFTIETIFDGIKYNYSCYIDQSKVGKILLMSTEATSDINGTEIIIPVKPNDFHAFISGTEFVTRHWDVKPTIIGGQIEYQNIVPTLKGDTWAVTKEGYNGAEFKLIVDGIEYPLDRYQLQEFCKSKLINVIDGIIYLYFKTGDISLSATREAVHLDKNSKSKIINTISEVEKFIKQGCQTQIDQATNLWDANIAYTKLCSTFRDKSFLEGLNWNGTKLHNQFLQLEHHEAHVYTFSKRKVHKRYNSKGPDTKIYYSSGTVFHFENNIKIFTTISEDPPQAKDVKLLFENDKNLKTVYIIKPKDNTGTIDTSWPKPTLSLEDLDKKYNLTELGAIDFVIPEKKASKKSALSGTRLVVFKFNNATPGLEQVSYNSIDDDQNKKVIALFERDPFYSTTKRNIKLANGKIIQPDMIQKILEEMPGYSVYAIDKKIADVKMQEHFDDFLPIEKFIEDYLNKSTVGIKEAKYARNHNDLHNINVNEDTYKNIAKNLIVKNSLFNKFITAYTYLNKIESDIKAMQFINVYELLNGEVAQADVLKWGKDNPEFDVQSLGSLIEAKYPLLGRIDSYYSRTSDKLVIDYINLVDEHEMMKKDLNK